MNIRRGFTGFPWRSAYRLLALACIVFALTRLLPTLTAVVVIAAVVLATAFATFVVCAYATLNPTLMRLLGTFIAAAQWKILRFRSVDLTALADFMPDVGVGAASLVPLDLHLTHAPDGSDLPVVTFAVLPITSPAEPASDLPSWL